MKKQEEFGNGDKENKGNFNFNFKEEKFSTLKSATKSSAEFIITLLRSLNPDSYRKLNEKSFGKAVKFFLSLTFITLILAFIIYFPSFNSSLNEISKNLNLFTSLNFHPNISANSSIKILDGIYYLKLNKTNSTKASDYEEEIINNNFITFEDNKFYIKKLCAPIVPLYCSIKKTNSSRFSYDNFFNIKQNKDLERIIKSLILFLIPYLFLIIYIILIIRNFIIILFVALITFIILTSLRRRASFIDLLKMSIYASSIFIILSILGYSSEVMIIFSLSAYLLLFFFGVLINYLNVDF